jgi:hypothetical protein
MRHEQNRGKGAAIRTGMLAATGHVRVFTDVDLPFGTDLFPVMHATFATAASMSSSVTARSPGRRTTRPRPGRDARHRRCSRNSSVAS